MKMVKRFFVSIALVCVCCGAIAAPRLCLNLLPDENWYATTWSPTRTWELMDGSDNLVRGVEVCSSTSNTSGIVKASLGLSTGANKYCWCRMIHPVLSKNWVSATQTFSGEDACLLGCNDACRDSFIGDETRTGYLLNDVIYKL